MPSTLKDITVRTFSGSSVPVGSELGRILLRSEDSKKVVRAIRDTARGGSGKVILSSKTMNSLKKAWGK